MRLTEERKTLLMEVAVQARKQFEGSPAEEYLVHRGLVPDQLDKFRLGYVDDSAPSGFDKYRGTICVPYLRRGATGSWSVAALRFRCIRDECVRNPDGSFRDSKDEVHVGHGKMQSMASDTPRIYNTEAIVRSSDVIAICEGEADTWTAEMCGIPAVGIQGVNGWKDYFTELFIGYRTVFVLSDGDEAGRGFAQHVAKLLPNALEVPMAPGMDVNRTHKDMGREALLSKVGM
ncbi:toprim domain-containing protein [Streptomyces vinaceus]|uniref:toprim domain-containing protein n=1 Tax=Streptomyces vinaceus TaxID=1960 RepID=UPI0036A2E84F